MGNLVSRRGRNLFLEVVVAEHMEVAALLQIGKLRRAGIRFKRSQTLVSKGHHLHDNIIYYDASAVQKFVGTGTATQHECMILEELVPLCSDGSWA